MLKLSTDEKRSLQFEVSIQGIDYKELTGSLKFVVEEIEYGFPATILEDHIDVEVPPLDDIIFKGMKDGVVADCKLEIFGNGFYLNPWSGQFKFKTPVKMEAKMRYAEDIEPVSESKPKPKVKKAITATLKEEVTTKEPKEEVEEKDIDLAKDEMLEVLFERAAKKTSFRKPGSTPKKKPQPPKRKVTRQQLVESKVKSKVDKIGSLVDSLLSGNQRARPIQEQKKVRKKKAVKIENIDNPVSLMESLGLRNPRVQKLMLERAETMGGSDNESMMRTLRQMLTNQRPMSTFEQFTERQRAQELDIDE